MLFARQVQYKKHVHQRCLEVQGADFLRSVAFWSIRSSGLILRDRCSTSYDRGRRSTLDRWSGNIAKRVGTRPSALHSTFHF